MSRVLSSDGPEASETGPSALPSPRVEAALHELRAGRMVLLTEEAGRAALVMAAERATPDAVVFMTTRARGALRVALTPERFEELRIPTGRDAGLPEGAAMGVPVGLRDGRTSDHLTESVSAWADTIRALGDPRTRAIDLARPGQVFPVRVEPEGVPPGDDAGFPRAGLTLVSLAGCYPAALVCGVLDDAGGRTLVERRGIETIDHGEVLDYGHSGRVLRRDVEVLLPTRYGEFRLRAYVDDVGEQTHLALIAGEPEGKEDVLAHVHSPCLVGDMLRSLRCDCGVLLEAAMLRVQTGGEGVIVYARAEARWMEAKDVGRCRIERQDPAAREDYAVGARIFRDMGLGRVRLITDSGLQA